MLTRVLVAINVIVYIWERTTGALDSNAALVAHGALYGPVVFAGEWWRLVTSAFLHGSEMHILFNMIALWQVGTFVEAIFGTPRMAIIYALSMLGSGYAIAWFTPDDVTVGASGAIFGLFGALAVGGLRLGARGRDLMRQVSGIIVINLVIGFLPGTNVSNSGHIGGLVVGTLVGLVLFRKPRPPVAVPAEPAYAQRIDAHDDPGIETIEHPPLESTGTQPHV